LRISKFVEIIAKRMSQMWPLLLLNNNYFLRENAREATIM